MVACLRDKLAVYKIPKIHKDPEGAAKDRISGAQASAVAGGTHRKELPRSQMVLT